MARGPGKKADATKRDIIALGEELGRLPTRSEWQQSRGRSIAESTYYGHIQGIYNRPDLWAPVLRRVVWNALLSLAAGHPGRKVVIHRDADGNEVSRDTYETKDAAAIAAGWIAEAGEKDLRGDPVFELSNAPVLELVPNAG